MSVFERISSLNSKVSVPVKEIQCKNRHCILKTIIAKEYVLCLGNGINAEPDETQTQKQRKKLAVLNWYHLFFNVNKKNP